MDKGGTSNVTGDRSVVPWRRRLDLLVEDAFPVFGEGPEPDVLFGFAVLRVGIVATASLGGSDMDPA